MGFGSFFFSNHPITQVSLFIPDPVQLFFAMQWVLIKREKKGSHVSYHIFILESFTKDHRRKWSNGRNNNMNQLQKTNDESCLI